MKNGSAIYIVISVILILISAGLVLSVLSGCGLFSASDPVKSRNSSSAALTAIDPAQTSGTESESAETSRITTSAAIVTTEPAVLDVTAPSVTGEDFEITQGDSVSYKKQIVVTDDYDENPTIEIDNSAVDLDTPGVYPVVYTVTDSAGNSTVLTLMLTVKERIPDEAATEEYVLYRARQILSEITDDSMSDLQVAYAIYRWTKYNIGYISTSDKTNWVIGAYDAFTKRQGDCFSYFSASKALLTAAGIENLDVEKLRTPERDGRHYWSLVNVGDGWYHFDTTVFIYEESNFFMLTDAEIKAWDDKYYRGEHTYLADGLPEVATESIKDKVDYSSPTLKE